MFNLKFGSDPEGFLFETATGKYISAHDRIPGTKQEPHKVNGGAIQVDGVAVEINIDPVTTCAEWVENHRKVVDELYGYLGGGVEVHWQPIAVFDAKYFRSLPPEVQAMGCDPDFNAWTGKQNAPPNSGVDTLEDGSIFRCAGGHVHIGWADKRNPNDEVFRTIAFDLVKALDRDLGLRSRGWDKDTRRRSLYGKAGACRIKPYGVEYRTLSSVWMQSDTMQKLVFNLSKLCAMRYFRGKTISHLDYKNIMQYLG